MPLPDDILERAEKLLEYHFSDAALLEEALTHSSAADDRLSSNERMEFLGDAVLDLVICEKIYTDFPEHQEGELTKMKSAIVSRRTCAAIARETGLSDLLIVGKGIVGRQEIPGSLAAAVYESVVAAIYQDGGLEPVKTYVLRTMDRHINAIAKAVHAHNYKAVLQQHAQREFGTAPHYELLDEKGPDHSKCFEICVNLNGRRFEGAWGPNKKAAEQKAALMALRELEVFDEEEFDAAIEVIDALAPQAL